MLIVDGFLASGATIAALARLVERAGATVAGIRAAIEKWSETGRANLAYLSVPIVSLAAVAAMNDDGIQVE
ncbi:MAG: hypothetical protein MUQ10_08870 [Anaerolineae bacterium]|nr:hypothetical protein [Anaerolineae bacterium]